MKILLIWPKPKTSFLDIKKPLQMIGIETQTPPLGLLTIAAMLPPEWESKLINMDIDELKDEDILWADYVFISGYYVYYFSAKEVVKRCSALGTKIVAGGPLFTETYEDFPEVDHFVLHEGEVNLPCFIEDIKAGKAKRFYDSEEKADIRKTPVPRWDLIDVKKYAMLSLQCSRGCPHDCEFCNIPAKLGNSQRAKAAEQVIKELDAIYKTGWRGTVAFVDDNFVGNVERLKKELLPAIIEWMEENKYPFSFGTQLTAGATKDEKLMSLLSKAGINTVIVGFETPNKKALLETNKIQNLDIDIVEAANVFNSYGIKILGFFIVGFDSDTEDIFDELIDVIQKSCIVSVAVSCLYAHPNSKLYDRLQKEGRIEISKVVLLEEAQPNFIPKMGKRELLIGWLKVVRSLYCPKNYYYRLRNFLNGFKPFNNELRGNFKLDIRSKHIIIFLKMLFLLGVKGDERSYFWKGLFWAIKKRRSLVPYYFFYAVSRYYIWEYGEKHFTKREYLEGIPIYNVK